MALTATGAITRGRPAPQPAFLLHSLLQGTVLHFVFHPAADQDQLVPMQHQLPQIPLLTVRCPQPPKAPFHQQLQNVGCVPLVGLLLAHVTGPDLRCIPDPDCVPQIPSVPRTTGCCPWPPCRSAPPRTVLDRTAAPDLRHAPTSALRFLPFPCPANSPAASWDENHSL